MNYAFVTVLSTDNYYKGVIALFESIKKTNTKYSNFVVIVNEEISNSILNDFIERKYTVIRKNKLKFDFIKNNKYQYWINTFDKFHIFDLNQYDKILYLDSDMYVTKNIDELFEYPHMSAVRAGYEKNHEWISINSGLMVIEPKKSSSEKLIQTLKNMNIQKDIGDQDIIENHFDWKHKNLAISEKYNMFSINVDLYINQYGYKKEEMSIIHFSGSKKPWMFNKKEQENELKKLEENNKYNLLSFYQEYIKLLNSIGKKLTIITPYYNTLKETQNLALTLIPQLTEEVEWIIIDDGCNEQELEKLHARVIHLKENSGNASHPRNIGIDNAKGDYITFIDSDDNVSSNYIKSIINKIDNDTFDYCYFGWTNTKDNYIIEEEPLKWNHSVWNCIYKRDIIGNERFNEKYNIDEDGDFNKRVRKGKRANILEILYIYYFQKRKDSITSLYFQRKIEARKE